MSRTTHGLVLPDVGQPFELRKISLPAMQADEVLVEMRATGICNTDLACASGKVPFGPNAVLGHEGAGVVLAAGSTVSSVAPGDKVILSFAHCEACDNCTSGFPSYCHSFVERNFSGRRPDGSAAMLDAGAAREGKEGAEAEAEPLHSTYFGQSSFAKHSLVQKSSVVKVAPDTKLELFAPMGCGIMTGAGAVINTLDVREGSAVVVFGVGSVGMAAVMAAGMICRARTVIAIDLEPARVELAKTVGATHGILGDDEHIVEKVQKLCPPSGADYAIDCTGIPSVVKNAIECLGKRGKAATVGVPVMTAQVNVDIYGQLVNGKEYRGSCMGGGVPSKVCANQVEEYFVLAFCISACRPHHDADCNSVSLVYSLSHGNASPGILSR